MTRPGHAWLAILLACSGPAWAGTLEAYVATPTGVAVADAAVVAEPLSGAIPGKRTMDAIEQRDRELNPYLTIVQKDTAIEFPNRDPFKHHLYSFSPAKTFEIKLYAGKPVKPIVFDKSGEVALGCNIHDWMEAYVLVVDSPYFAKTGSNGRALIANIPPGHYRLRLWHPRQKKELPLREIEIGAATAKLDAVMDVAPRIVKPKPPLDHDQY